MRDARNVQNVQDAMEKDFAELVGEFRSLNSEVANLLREDERTCDQDNWFEVKMAPIREFMKETKRWIAAVHESNYSISQAGDRNAERGSLCGTQVSHATAASRVTSTRVRQEAQHAALLEHAAALKRKQELEFESARIQAEKEFETARIQAEKEELEMKTALTESQAKLKVLKEYERSEDSYSYHTPVQNYNLGM